MKNGNAIATEAKWLYQTIILATDFASSGDTERAMEYEAAAKEHLDIIVALTQEIEVCD